MIRAGIDWGSSSFRAYRFDGKGEIIDTLESDKGIKFANDAGFEQTMFDQVGDWLRPGDIVMLSGMITSRNGWIESVYVECPARTEDMINRATRHVVHDIELIFLPGLCQHNPPEIMRGEELQLLGMHFTSGAVNTIIPGTHSKWAHIDQGVVKCFRTIATGELFEVLLEHSLVGALSNNKSWNRSVFLDGVEKGYATKTIISDLFVCRSGILLSKLSKDALYSYLSGLLIGNEIREGLHLIPPCNEDLVLIGSNNLCQTYQTALGHLGYPSALAEPHAAARGFQHHITQLLGRPNV